MRGKGGREHFCCSVFNCFCFLSFWVWEGGGKEVGGEDFCWCLHVFIILRIGGKEREREHLCWSVLVFYCFYRVGVCEAGEGKEGGRGALLLECFPFFFMICVYRFGGWGKGWGEGKRGSTLAAVSSFVCVSFCVSGCGR